MPATASARPAADCVVHISRLRDARHDADMLGMVIGRAVHAPADSRAWLRAILGGLRSRGVNALVEDETGSAAPQVEVEVSLLTAWVTDTASNKTANVVLRLQPAGDSGVANGHDYRGNASTVNWSGGAGELQSLVDRAFASALDGMAAELRAQCAR